LQLPGLVLNATFKRVAIATVIIDLGLVQARIDFVQSRIQAGGIARLRLPRFSGLGVTGD
jgi:hypothetical protein